MPAAERFVLTGLSRLTVRVATLLCEREAEVVMVTDPEDELVEALPAAVKVVGAAGSWTRRLRDAELERSDCLLALSEDDLENLHVVAAAHDVASDVPVVLRAFDARLVEQFQFRGNVRRCYSSSALAAPAFAAAVFEQHVVETLRILEDEVPLCVLTLRPGSPVEGLSAGEMKAEWGCAAVAHAPHDREWEPALGDNAVLGAGDRVLVGGLLVDVLRLAMHNSAVASTRRRWRDPRRLPRLARQEPTGTLVVIAALALAALLMVTSIVFALALDLGPIDAVYRAITNAFGDVGLESAAGWVKVFGIAVMIAGAVLVGVVLAHLTAMFTASRLEQQASRKARRMSGHVVIAGLGLVGFRTDRLLDALGIATVIIDQHADLSRFREAASFHTPVLSGDARLSENLERAGIRDASCVVACTDNDLANVSACVEAKQLNPEIRTIVRIFDDDLADRLDAFGIDAALSMSSAAASAFVGAATDEHAVRRMRLDSLELVAFRHELVRPVTGDEVREWRERGLRILAVRPPGLDPQPPTAALAHIAARSEIIVAGPERVLEECLELSIRDR